MKLLKLLLMWCWLAAFCGGRLASAQTPVFINEVLFNPPSATDTPHEYVELRGLPSYVLPQGTYFVAVEGDFDETGVIQNVFDLSGRKLGANGHLVLLQKGHVYAANPSATVLVNSGSGPGWGSGETSSIGHEGEGDKTELVNASATFFLIRTSYAPEPNDDVDENNDGILDGAAVNWIVLDSVGVLDNTGAGDIAYGGINFRRNAPPGNQATASGVIVSVGFTGTYVARAGNTSGSAGTDWMTCNNLTGTAPNWSVPSSENTTRYATQPLNHIGRPNFGASGIRGLVITHSGGSTELAEGGTTDDSYTIALNATPTGNVTVQVNAPAPLQVSIDGGANFFSSRTLIFNSTTPRTVLVRALDDAEVDTSPYTRNIGHQITSSADTLNFPLSLALAPAPARVIENDWLLLNELKVNPPGNLDRPYEFVEIRGVPGTSLTNVQFLALEGDKGDDPGRVTVVVDLTGQRLGANGLLFIGGSGHSYSVAPSTTTTNVPAFGSIGGVLGNGSGSFLLISAQGSIAAGSDLDGGDNGVPEGLPLGTTILDAVGWRDGNTNDVIYGGVMLVDGDTPDAAARFPDDNTASSAAAWFFGDLPGANPATVVFDPDDASENFPLGTDLSPGEVNAVGPHFTPIKPVAGAIGDPTNPKAFLTLTGFTSSVTITATSTNPAVVPNGNLQVVSLGGGRYSVALEPIGIGYSRIDLTATDGMATARGSFKYAASERCDTDTRFHTWVSDASTAIPIDANYMFVGDDEVQTIRIYRRNQSGDPVAGFDMTPFLGLTDIEEGRPREVDIEGSTRVGNRIYWIGAHSHANIAEERTNRARIFATDVSGSGAGSQLNHVGHYNFLKVDLANWDENNGHGKGANYYGITNSIAEGKNPKEPDGSGFNIEGLTMAPSDANVGYIGFRAPLVPAHARTHALIVPVLNFASVAISTGPPGSAVFGAPIELDLYGRGIRSIERVGSEYLIVAGIPGDFPGEYPNDFRLYTWSGNPADRPQERAADLRGLNPEGIIELPTPPWTAQSLIHILSDCGRKVWYNDDIIAKFHPVRNFKKFRTDIVALGAITKTAPVVTFSEHNNGQFTIGWRSVAGDVYRVQYKTSFNDPAWSDLSGDVLATGTYSSKTDANALRPGRFYRVTVLP